MISTLLMMWFLVLMWPTWSHLICLSAPPLPSQISPHLLCSSHTGLLLTGSQAHHAHLTKILRTSCSLCLELLPPRSPCLLIFFRFLPMCPSSERLSLPSPFKMLPTHALALYQALVPSETLTSSKSVHRLAVSPLECVPRALSASLR